MKQFLSSEQTAKLIELGFEKPKSCSGFSIDETKDAVFYYDYSIGELIEMLPANIKDEDDEDNVWELSLFKGLQWEVVYGGIFECCMLTKEDELIDALFDMVVKLKEEDLI